MAEQNGTGGLERLVDGVAMKLVQRLVTVIGIPIAILVCVGAYNKFDTMSTAVTQLQTTLALVVPSMENRIAVLEARMNGTAPFLPPQPTHTPTPQ